MKARRRYSTSSGESEEESIASADSAASDSESEASESSDDERSRRRDKKHKRRAPSSDSDSEEETRRRAKKRKHKKKKRKHSKKRRRDEREEESYESEGEDKHERKHKQDEHKHRHSSSRSPSVQEVPVTYSDSEHAEVSRGGGGRGARLQSVVQGRRRSISPVRHRSRSPQQHTYYQQEKSKYSRSASVYSGDGLGGEAERFYRGSSKDRSLRSDRNRYRDTRYEEQERYEGYGGGGGLGGGRGVYAEPALDERPRRSPGYQQGYAHRTQKYEQEEYERPRDYTYLRERAQRDRGTSDFNGRQSYNQHDDRSRQYTEKVAALLCLLCGTAHAGRTCRSAPALFNRDYRRPAAPSAPAHHREDKRALAKRERDRAERGHREERVERRDDRVERRDDRVERREDRVERRDDRVEQREDKAERRGERRERVRPPSPRPEPPRQRKSPQHREPTTKSPRREEQSRERKPKAAAAAPAARVETERKRGADKGEGEKKEERREGKEKRERSPRRKDKRSRFNNEAEGDSFTWGKTEAKKEAAAPEDKDKPNFALSGKLAADANTVNGILLKYSEPPDAKQPKRKWRFYPFKGDKALPILYIHRQSCFVFGRELKAVDIPLEHPSVSKQHAALQYRATAFTRPDGTQARRVRPYVIDLDSANGTFVNNKKIEPRRYVELLERDVVKFGFSQREYVLLHENSKDDSADDDQEMGVVGVVSIATVKREKQKKKERAEDGD